MLDNAGSSGRFQDTESGRFVSFKDGQLRAATTRELIANSLDTNGGDALLFKQLQEADQQLLRFKSPVPETKSQINVERVRLILKAIDENKEIFE